MSGLPNCYRCKSQPCACKDGITLYHGDCRDILPHLSDIDGCCTDPPYGLEFMGQEWDKLDGAKPPGYVEKPRMNKAAFAKMGAVRPNFYVAGERAQTWHQQWAEALLVALKPGAPLLAFGGTRTHHRLICAIEDAGFEVRDCLMWLYATGFPKSHDISKAIDKAAGAEREVVGNRNQCFGLTQAKGWNQTSTPRNSVIDDTTPATEAAKLWDGWGTALAPAWEPITLAMKPLDGTFAQNALKHGVAGINVDGGRIASSKRPAREPARRDGNLYGSGLEGSRAISDTIEGRWPKNVILSHHPDCVCVGTRKVKGDKRVGGDGTRPGGFGNIGADGGSPKPNATVYGDPDGTETVEKWGCVDGCPIRMLDEQSIARGIHGAGYKTDGKHCAGGKGSSLFGSAKTDVDAMRYGDTGGASRFYFVAKASRSDREDGLIDGVPCINCGELNSDVHLTEKRGDETIVHTLTDIDIFTVPTLSVVRENSKRKGYPWRIVPCLRNDHPTVKPTELMQGLLEYLLTLIATPAGGVVIDPFCGSGSTLVAAKRLGRPAIGIELDEKWCRTASERLRQ